MHDILFGVKRAFHKSTWFGRGLLAGYGITPSRFDILYILHNAKLKAAWQSSIRKFLGITAATTSIMVRALEALGLVRRNVSEYDKRQREVWLTERGRELIARAIKVFHEKDIADYFVRRLVCSTWWDKEQSSVDLDTFENTLIYLRARLKDKALLAYGSHPDH